MTRIEFHGFGNAISAVTNRVSTMLAGKGYFDLTRIRFVICTDQVVDYEGQHQPFVRVISHLNRNGEIASTIARELHYEVEFIVINANFP